MAMEPHNVTHFATRAAFRGWLEKNHASSDELWVGYWKKATGRPSVTWAETVDEALCFGWIDGIMKRIDDRQHVIRFTPRRRDSIWSEVNKARVERMVEAGLMTEAGQALVDHARATGEWEKASGSLRDWPVPDEVESHLAGDADARAWFEGLAPSYRRQMLGWIHGAKRDETRQRRIAQVLQMIAERRKLAR